MIYSVRWQCSQPAARATTATAPVPRPVPRAGPEPWAPRRRPLAADPLPPTAAVPTLPLPAAARPVPTLRCPRAPHRLPALGTPRACTAGMLVHALPAATVATRAVTACREAAWTRPKSTAPMTSTVSMCAEHGAAIHRPHIGDHTQGWLTEASHMHNRPTYRPTPFPNPFENTDLTGPV